MKLLKDNIYIYIYYAVLFVLVAVRTSLFPPSAIIRLVFLLAFFLPLFLKYSYLYLPCLVAFTTVSTKHFAFGYMPYEMSTYAALSLFSFIVVYGLSRNQNLSINPTFFGVFLYILFINLAYSGSPQNITYSFITVGLGVLITEVGGRANIKNYMLHCFVYTSLALALIYLMNFEQFLESYNANDGMERSGWMDANYLSCIIGMGSLSSLILLLKNKQAKLYSRILWVVTISISTISQVLMASRGGLLAVSSSFIILILFTDVKRKYKVSIIFVLILFITWLYSNGYLDLLNYRIENDTDGSGRLNIWLTKLTLFAQNGNMVSWIFGLGSHNAMALSESGNLVGFHNDFLAILCGYGFIGLFIFIYLMVIYPLLKSSKNSRPIIVTLIVYLMLSCMTLEPITLGQIVFLAFYYMILLFAED